MKKHHYLIIACQLLSACGQPITYIGESMKSTASVDVFYSANTVKRNYKVVGHLTSHHYKLAYAKQRFISRAKRAGADAIIILNVDTNSTQRLKLINADVLKYN